MTAESTGSLLRDILVYESRLAVLIETERRNSSCAIANAEEKAARIVRNATEDAAEFRRRAAAEIIEESSRIAKKYAEESASRISGIESSFNKASPIFAEEIARRILHHVV
ncbi:MAG TPA: hypothetical protein PKK43_09590 [Spirochaetota bacterium]|nr:hypothetical protein [Spirochaetota bacterium]